MNKESLKKLTVQELEGQLMEVKENFRQASSTLAIERQKQLAKTKIIRGNAKKRKKELIEQILKIQRETQRVQAKIQAIEIKNNQVISHVNMGKIKVQFNNGTKEGPDNAEMWAAIKTYKDNVKRGVIKEKTDYESLSSEEQADYAYEVMTRDDYYKYIKLANEKAEKLEADALARGKMYASEEYYKEMYPGF